MTFKHVIDKGPQDKPYGEPKVDRMHAIDADHAVATDPERFEVVDHTPAERRALLRTRMSIDQRVAALEAAYDELVAEAEGDDPEPAVVE